MVAAGLEESTVHRVIKAASHLFLSERLKDFDALNGNQPTVSPPLPITFHQAESQWEGIRNLLANAWHGLTAASFVPSPSHLEFSRPHILQPCCWPLYRQLQWPKQRPPSSQDLLTICSFAPIPTAPPLPGHSLLVSGIHSTNNYLVPATSWALCWRMETQPELLSSRSLRRKKSKATRGRGCDGEEMGGMEAESHSSTVSDPKNKTTTDITKSRWKLNRFNECACEFHNHWLKEGWNCNVTLMKFNYNPANLIASLCNLGQCRRKTGSAQGFLLPPFFFFHRVIEVGIRMEQGWRISQHWCGVMSEAQLCLCSSLASPSTHPPPCLLDPLFHSWVPPPDSSLHAAS